MCRQRSGEKLNQLISKAIFSSDRLNNHIIAMRYNCHFYTICHWFQQKLWSKVSVRWSSNLKVQKAGVSASLVWTSFCCCCTQLSWSFPALATAFLFITRSSSLSLSLSSLALATAFLFIGPESDHWECLSVTHSLTDSLTDSLLFSKLDWCDPGMWRCQLKTCWGCYCCSCWCWESCWQQFVTDLGAEVWS